ncbi:type I DNA topoisomerase [Candidatus Daviesbacteria bacterium]|nr:type I DNA topoisomerase [Candidatus Daviesbacteria bacterium]
MQNLVIVESPTKARTLSKFLGKTYRIEASMGHVRDLPKSEIGVDEENFEPKYIVPRDKKKKVNELKKLALGSKTLYLATDPDREGEAIAWHLAALLQGERGKGKGKSSKKNIDKKSSPFTLHPSPSIHRVEFHEITKDAISEAFEHPREINLQLVDAQQARRVLDRLVGYKLSPILWKKIKRGLSAGRVQSVTLRLIVEREREIEAFNAEEYWSIEVTLESSRKSLESRFIAQLVTINGEKAVINNGDLAAEIVKKLEVSAYKIEKITKKEVKRSPAPPFITSTLQQASGNKLGMSAKKTMMIAQNLYEQGFITYMRTDSVNLSTQALDMTRDYIGKVLGKDFLPEGPRFYKSKSKNAQEAHEAIRPTDLSVTAEKLNGDHFTRDHKRLYDLVYKRMVASQVRDAVFDQTTVEVLAQVAGPAESFLLRAIGSTLKFPGWLKVYGISEEGGVKREEEEESEDVKNQVIPELEENEPLNQKGIKPLQHFTQPSPRYTEASLVKKLEELGIGRPSTYAPILSTIQERFYVEKIERKFNPTSLGFTVNDFLMKYFPDVFDYQFTAQMEDSLDEISRGEKEWKSTIGAFYKPLAGKLTTAEETAEKIQLEVETVDKNCPKCGKQLIVRTGKFGKFLACSGFPECKHTERLEEKIEAKCPDDGGDVVVRKTRKGKTFFGCKNYPDCKFASWTKPK